MKCCIKLPFVGILLLLLCGCWVTQRVKLQNETGDTISVYSPRKKQWLTINTGSARTFEEARGQGGIQTKEDVFEINLVQIIYESAITPPYSLDNPFQKTLGKRGFVEHRYTCYQTFTYHFVATNNLIYFRPVKKTFWGERPVPLSNWDNIVSNQPPNFPLNLKSGEWEKKGKQ